MRAAALVLALALAAAGCSKRPDDGTKPEPVENLPELALRDDTPNLLLTWLDEKGKAHTETHPKDIPANGRGLVRVVIADREDGTRDRFYVADLNTRKGDGSYAVRTMSRRDWEAEIQKRREGEIAKFEPPPPRDQPPPRASGAPGPRQDVDVSKVHVIIYGASWCKPCHQAADYLKAKGVPYVLKDIDEDRAAATEMREKLERSGNRGGSIPVIDVRGQILIGFSERAVDKALQKAASGTVL